jgi:hypothetical protein
VKKYGPVSPGKHRKSLEHGSYILSGKFLDFFPVTFGQFPVLSVRNQSENIRKFSGRNTAPLLQRFPVFFFAAGYNDFSRIFPTGFGVVSVFTG